MTQTSEIPLIRLVDDDAVFRASQRMLLATRGWAVEEYDSAQDFLDRADLTRAGCILLDVRMPTMTGLQLQYALEQRGCTVPIVFLTGHGDISMAVHAMQHGAVSFLEKPVRPMQLMEVVEKVVEQSLAQARARRQAQANRAVFDMLTVREQQVVRLAALDTPNKVIARTLGIAEPTVKMHRAHAFAKLQVKSPLEAYRALERLGVAIDETDKEPS